MASATTLGTDYFDLSYRINGTGGGWTETHHLPTINLSQAKTSAAEILTARSRLLAADYKIVRATLSRYKVFKDSFRPAAYSNYPRALATEAAGPPEVPDFCNDNEVGLSYRFTTDSGRFRLMIIRGIRDEWVTNKKLSSILFPSPDANFAAPYTASTVTFVAGTTTGATVLKDYLSLVRDLTCNAISNPLYPATDPINTLRMETFSKFNFRGIKSHDTGSIYGSRGRKGVYA